MSWTGKNDLETLRVDADFFENGGKKKHFQNIRIRVDRQLNDLQTLRVDADFFETGEKKLGFQKYPDTCGRDLCLHFIKSKRLNRFAMFCRSGQFFETPGKFYLHLIQLMIIYWPICWML